MGLLLASSPRLPAPRYAWDWADTRYYQGPAGVGCPLIGTVRLAMYVSAVPDATQRVIVGHISNAQHGWRIQTGISGAGDLFALAGGSGGYVLSPVYTISAGDVGRILLAHVTVDSVLRMFVAGAEVGVGSGAVTVTDPGALGALCIGRYQHIGGFSGSPLGVVHLSLSATAMTPAQIADDAASIMARTRGIVWPSLPGEVYRYDASDIEATSDWHDRVSDGCTLTETGAVQVSEVP